MNDMLSLNAFACNSNANLYPLYILSYGDNCAQFFYEDIDPEKKTKCDNMIMGNFINIPGIFKEINEMIVDSESDEEINTKSAKVARSFLEKIFIQNRNISPFLDLHPDGSVIITFKNETGIFNITFSEKKKASWAVYFPKEKEEAYGHFIMNNNIPESIKFYIEHLT